MIRLRLHLQAFRLGQPALSLIERQKLLRLQLQRRRHVQNVETAVAVRNRVALGQVIGTAKHFEQMARRKHRHAARQVRFKLVQRSVRIRLLYALARIVGAQPNLEAKRLAEFVPEQFSDVEWFLHCGCVRRRSRGIGLPEVKPVQEAGVRVSRHERSPRLSANPRAKSSAE